MRTRRRPSREPSRCCTPRAAASSRTASCRTPSRRGSGSVDTVTGQYEFHVNRVAKALNPQDVTIFLFGMLNHVSSEDPSLANADPNSTARSSSINKVKYGADVVVDILPWRGAGFRFDRVQPNSKTPEQSFSTIYPRV